MTPARPPVTEDELHALVDGELPARRIPAVLDHLAAHPDAAADVASWLEQKAALRALFDAGTSAGADPAWREEAASLAAGVRGHPSFRRLARDLARRLFHARPSWAKPDWRWPAPTMLAGAGLLGLGLTIGLWAGGPDRLTARIDNFARSAVEAHVAPVSLRDVPLERALAGLPVRPPDLSAHGWELRGFRPAAIGDGGSTQFIYSDAGGHRRLSILIGRSRGTGDAGFSFVRQGRRAMFAWVDGRIEYALVGDLGRDELLHLAGIVHRGLDGLAQPMPSVHLPVHPVAERHGM